MTLHCVRLESLCGIYLPAYLLDNHNNINGE